MLPTRNAAMKIFRHENEECDINESIINPDITEIAAGNINGFMINQKTIMKTASKSERM